MDANDVVENLWHEADTIRRAVAAAYEAVSGPTPMPSSLTEVLAFIAENATGGGGCAAGQSCVTDSKLVAIADALNGSHTATGGDALADEIASYVTTTKTHLQTTHTLLFVGPPSPSAVEIAENNAETIGTLVVDANVVIDRVILGGSTQDRLTDAMVQIDAGTRLSGSTIDLPFGSPTLKPNPLADIALYLDNAMGQRATNTFESLVVYANASNDLYGMTLADFASIGWYIASTGGASVALTAWFPTFDVGE